MPMYVGYVRLNDSPTSLLFPYMLSMQLSCQTEKWKKITRPTFRLHLIFKAGKSQLSCDEKLFSFLLSSHCLIAKWKGCLKKERPGYLPFFCYALYRPMSEMKREVKAFTVNSVCKFTNMQIQFIIYIPCPAVLCWWTLLIRLNVNEPDISAATNTGQTVTMKHLCWVSEILLIQSSTVP